MTHKAKTELNVQQQTSYGINTLDQLDTEIIETIQWIAGIFIKRGIAVAPVQIKYLETEIDAGMEVLVIKELILCLQDLFLQYTQKSGKIHKYNRYIVRFNSIMKQHNNQTSLYGKKLEE